MRKLYFFLLLVIFIGLADSMYLSISALLGIAPICGVLHGCDVVASSPWSKFLGIPLAYYGVAYYVIGSVIAPMIPSSKLWQRLGVMYGLIGAGLSVWFVYIQAVLIGALCVYCVTSAIATFLILILTAAMWKKGSNANP